MESDLFIALRFWGTLFFVGAAAFPLTRKLFSRWYDQGYLFAKAVGLALVTYIVYVLGRIHVVPFTWVTSALAVATVFIMGLLAYVKLPPATHGQKEKPLKGAGPQWLIFFEELAFLAAFLVWVWVKGHEPSIHGLEKFMDYGFTQTILNSKFFPAPDMWYAGLPINYYYFGHTVMAVITRLSGIELGFTFNLMLCAIFAFTLTMSASMGYQLLDAILSHRDNHAKAPRVIGAILTAFLVTLAGNMQTIYAFTKGYTGDAVKPFWELLWPPGQFWAQLPEGMNRYWYANATRFIPFTIHEFPSYSFVVSDVHGHVLSIPFVLLAIALLIVMFVINGHRQDWLRFVFYGALTGMLLMTNALDGPIYLGLFILLTLILSSQPLQQKVWGITVTVVAAIAASVPFLSHFKSFVTGVAINCPPAFLANTRVGPLLFETVDKCQHSPLWEMHLLWGFFWFCGGWFLVWRLRNTIQWKRVSAAERVLAVFFVFSLFLIVFPEFLYFKDIYPAHFRSNTMFKLGYQAFMLFSMVSVAAIVDVIWFDRKKLRKSIFLLLLVPQLFLVSIYPIFSVRSYFNSLRDYQSIYGLGWLRTQYPDDFAGIEWLRNTIAQANNQTLPVIVEADGESYTDADRFSAFAGTPTVVGWAVHEWLWRGSYDVVVPRRDEVRVIYESSDRAEVEAVLHKYGVRFVIIGSQERLKYPDLREERFMQMGVPVFRSGATTIYAISQS